VSDNAIVRSALQNGAHRRKLRWFYFSTITSPVFDYQIPFSIYLLPVTETAR